MAGFVHLGILSPMVQCLVWGRQVGMAIEGLSKKVLECFEFPVPPLSEQHRIVTKVNELMALCDQLEQQQTDSITAHQTLVETLLATLTNSTTAEETAENWARIAEHFDTLFTTEHSVDQLKQTVLQLAVMGKLVPQNPDDEPASALLARIADEKARLVKEEKIKKQKPLPPIGEDEKPFALPDGWEWCWLENVTLHSEADWSPKCEPQARNGEQWGVLKVSAVTWGEYRAFENKRLPGHLDPRPECEVHEGDFLISRANTTDLVARSVVVPVGAPPRLMMSDKIIRFVFSSSVYSDYLSLVNNSPNTRKYYAAVAGGTSSSMKNVSRAQIQMQVVALPPEKEQRRMTAKYYDLLMLCRQLKTNIQQTRQTNLQLANAIVERTVA